jgi:hypothetical protein
MNKGSGPTGMLPAGGGRRVSPQQGQAPQPSLSPQISEKHIAKTLPRFAVCIPHLGHNGSIGRNLRQVKPLLSEKR